MFFGLFSSHLPFIILGAVYFITFAFASVQRMANAEDDPIVQDDNPACYRFSEAQALFQVQSLPDNHVVSDEPQTVKVPHIISFCLSKSEREKLLHPHSDPHYGIIPTRPPPFRS